MDCRKDLGLFVGDLTLRQDQRSLQSKRVLESIRMCCLKPCWLARYSLLDFELDRHLSH